jgi:hypothetical protein
MLTLWLSVLTGLTAEPLRFPGAGRLIGSESSRRQVAAPSYPWSSVLGEAFQFDWSEDFAVLGGKGPNMAKPVEPDPACSTGALL